MRNVIPARAPGTRRPQFTGNQNSELKFRKVPRLSVLWKCITQAVMRGNWTNFRLKAIKTLHHRNTSMLPWELQLSKLVKQQDLVDTGMKFRWENWKFKHSIEFTTAFRLELSQVEPFSQDGFNWTELLSESRQIRRLTWDWTFEFVRPFLKRIFSRETTLRRWFLDAFENFSLSSFLSADCAIGRQA